MSCVCRKILPVILAAALMLPVLSAWPASAAAQSESATVQSADEQVDYWDKNDFFGGACGTQTGTSYGPLIGKYTAKSAGPNYFLHNLNAGGFNSSAMKIVFTVKAENASSGNLFRLELCDRQNSLAVVASKTVSAVQLAAAPVAQFKEDSGDYHTVIMDFVPTKTSYEFRVYALGTADLTAVHAAYQDTATGEEVAYWQGASLALAGTQQGQAAYGDTKEGISSSADGKQGFLLFGCYTGALKAGTYSYVFRCRAEDIGTGSLGQVEVIGYPTQSYTDGNTLTIKPVTNGMFSSLSTDAEGYYAVRGTFTVPSDNAFSAYEGRISSNGNARLMVKDVTLLRLGTQSAGTEFLRGDANADKKINTTDALIALRTAVQKQTLSADQIWAANVDGKGAVTTTDALLILRRAVGVPGLFPGDESEYQMTASPYTGQTVYANTRAAQELSGSVTTFQVAASYSGSIDIPSDSVMVYATTIGQAKTVFPNWVQNASGRSLDVMIAVNRDGGEYYDYYPDRQGKDEQMRSDGTRILHSGTTYYMVPTADYVQYKLKLIEECMSYHPGFIAFEEPEMWHASGYSEGFKEEWQAYYGEPWTDPTTSPEALFKSAKLKTYLFTRIIETLGKRMKEIDPNVKVVIASHSTASYNAISITAGLNTYTGLDCVDGVIGQTWSDTCRGGMPYDGRSVTDVFKEGYMEYGTYTDMLSDSQLFYALADPKSDDGSFTWDDYRTWYQQTIAAQLLHQDINRFEIFPWPDRSFASAPSDYRTEQLGVFNALSDLSGKASTLYSGTQGIYFAQSDTMSWQYGSDYMTTSTTAASIYGLTIPLIEKGIPIGTKSLEHIQSAADLEGVELLLLSYDCMKPLSEQTNQAIADWVKAGGTVLYLGGHDAFENINGEWWSKKNQTPLQNLLADMGLSNVQVNTGAKDYAYLEWTGSNYFGQSMASLILSTAKNDYTASFSGTGFSTFLSAGGKSVGIEASVGAGRMLAVGLPSSFYSTTTGGAQALRELTQYALTSTSVRYQESDLMAVRRGDYVIAESMSGTQTIEGRYIDVFDSTLPVISQKVLEAGEPTLLYDISRVDTSLSPQMLYSGGEITDLTNTPDQTRYHIVTAANAVSATRIAAPGAKYPQSVTVMQGDQVMTMVSATWDPGSRSLLVNMFHDTPQTGTPYTVTVVWGDTLQPLSGGTFKMVSVLTNSNNEDAEFLYRNTAGANGSLRFADLNGEIVYKFDLKKYPDARIYMNVFQNYLIQVSDHDGDWITKYDYSLEHPEHLTTGGNNTTVSFDTKALGYEDVMYVRIANTDPSQGWGGSITGLSVIYMQ